MGLACAFRNRVLEWQCALDGKVAAVNPFQTSTYADAINFLAEQYGDREALLFAGRRYSFADIKRESDRAAARWASLGLPSGSKVAIWMTNRPEFIWYWFGAAQSGLVAVILNTRLRHDEFSYQLAQSDSTAIVVPGRPAFRDFLGELVQACPELASRCPGQLNSAQFPVLRAAIVCDCPSVTLPGVLDWSEPHSPALDSMPVTDVNTPSMILYSSGTTALPKGAMLSHCVWRKAYDAGARLGLSQADCLYLNVPLFGVMGSVGGILTMWSHGGRVVLAERFDVDDCVEALITERCTVIHLLPAMIDKLGAHPRYKEVVETGALRTSLALTNDQGALRRIAEELQIRGVVAGYGMTELTGAAARPQWDEPIETRIGTLGTPLPDVLIRIVDPDTGQDVPVGSSGEIWIGGYCVMLGYYNQPEETQRCITPDGYFRTGDLGVRNIDGTLRFLRRLKDGYKHKGFNVSPPEVEAVASKHPDVAAVAVIGVPDQLNGEIGVAFVVPRTDRALEIDSFVKYMSQRLASYKIPSHVIIMDTLPLTAGTEKIQKFKLRELASEYLASVQSAGDLNSLVDKISTPSNERQP
jgi:acyl-CoA synthetase (AMP-forming)/AMP-acid ligase II